MRENVFTFDLERKVLILLAAIVVAALIGPFGTYDDLTFWQRVVFWTLLFAGSFLFMVPMLYIFGTGRLLSRLPVPVRMFGAAAFGSLPISALSIFLFHDIRAEPSNELWASFPTIYGQVLGVCLAILVIEFHVWPRLFPPPEDDPATVENAPAPTPQNAAPDPGRPVCALIEHLPAKLRTGRIIAISMQDHYAHIATTAGEALVLIRLRDAIALLDGLPGVQTHRSHWVSAEFAQTLKRDGRRHVLVLKNGHRVPVAASRVTEVRAMLARQDADHDADQTTGPNSDQDSAARPD